MRTPLPHTFLSILIYFFIPIILVADQLQSKVVYIIYLGEHTGGKAIHEIEATHHSYLQSVKHNNEEDASSSLVYSYKHSINGFAAELTPEQASKLLAMEEVVSVFPSHPRKHKLHTTRSWEFVGIDNQPDHQSQRYDTTILNEANYGKDVIIGMLDSGFWPESKSFSDEGMGPVPNSWNGICQTGQDFNSSHCNRKVIGARYYLNAYQRKYGPLNTTLDYLSPRDRDGHGTHTASTAAGRQVPGASFLRTFARGTASGGAPLARLAIYKACWAIPGQQKAEGNTCFEADMLAAIDDAIADGVHVLSASIGTTKPMPIMEDGIAIGALHATKRGIVVVCSAGNSGPTPGTLSNPAPWIITVGASSLDRSFPAPVLLGNGVEVEGETVTTYRLDHKKRYPLLYGSQVELPTVPRNLSGQCMPYTLSPTKARGTIVLCMRGSGSRIGKGVEVKRAGGAGFILGNQPSMGNDISVDSHVLPATAVGTKQAIHILNYINSAHNPTATILPATTKIHIKPAPSMASFTSRGPNLIDPNLLKPDITAPGVNILAAWSGADSPTKTSGDHRTVQWNFESGTSMACPHVSGAAALVKAIHPTWSSAAIRSALMTSSSLTNNIGGAITDATGQPADSFQFGAGHLKPTKAVNPGLVYDSSYNDYLLYLCGSGVTNIDPSFKCPKSSLPKTNDLNYPSIAVVSQMNGTVTVKREVTNMGRGKSVYFASIKPPAGYEVEVQPSILSFNRVGQKKSFRVSFYKKRDEDVKGSSNYAFGWLTWFDGFHSVRSPMVVSSA